ncbi:glutaminyl-peptide cyclotransferase [Brytella acorum]|uniref:Glutaminyl-peptide cyclotransferase n=1 Tax=Brytella acorum TaxID=2959299 RepID=A0AA35XX45_9PROT|nr:glutaminyl-peptide cyclotransferase [Brytella acorum]MDF3625395.1 glutaminyl-peptide cyclotransferase [Brytella acorum]CAI9121541.1 glutaminyl-peptide cyclotransferase [Brytella acorum]
MKAFHALPLLSLCLMTDSALAQTDSILPTPVPDTLPVTTAHIVRTFPHDPTAFTEGLLFDHGVLFESTGYEGHSFIREEKLENGVVLRQTALPPDLFGEGIAAWHHELLSVTWRDGLGFRWSLPSFRRAATLHYTGEGWGMTTLDSEIVLSDGTPVLRFLNPAAFRVTHTLRVTAAGVPVSNLNELEYVNGEILANVWMTNEIARIDPHTGHVKGWIDLTPLARQVHATDRDAVPNGIAYDRAGKHLYVTGKYWPTLFEIRTPAPADTRGQ